MMSVMNSGLVILCWTGIGYLCLKKYTYPKKSGQILNKKGSAQEYPVYRKETTSVRQFLMLPFPKTVIFLPKTLQWEFTDLKEWWIHKTESSPSTHRYARKAVAIWFPSAAQNPQKEGFVPIKGLSDFLKSQTSHIPFNRQKCKVMSESLGFCQNFSLPLDQDSWTF